MQEGDVVDVSDPFAAVDQVNPEHVRDMSRIPALLVIDAAHSLTVGIQQRLQCRHGLPCEKHPVLGFLCVELPCVLAHHLGGVRLRIKAQRDQPDLAGQIRTALQLAMNALQDEARQRATVRIRADGVNEAQEHEAIVPEDLVQANPLAAVEKHFCVCGRPNRGKPVAPRFGGREPKVGVPGGEHRRGFDVAMFLRFLDALPGVGVMIVSAVRGRRPRNKRHCNHDRPECPRPRAVPLIAGQGTHDRGSEPAGGASCSGSGHTPDARKGLRRARSASGPAAAPHAYGVATGLSATETRASKTWSSCGSPARLPANRLPEFKVIRWARPRFSL
jgi:hypothetical protein